MHRHYPAAVVEWCGAIGDECCVGDHRSEHEPTARAGQQHVGVLAYHPGRRGTAAARRRGSSRRTAHDRPVAVRTQAIDDRFEGRANWSKSRAT